MFFRVGLYDKCLKIYLLSYLIFIFTNPLVLKYLFLFHWFSFSPSFYLSVFNS